MRHFLGLLLIIAVILGCKNAPGNGDNSASPSSSPANKPTTANTSSGPSPEQDITTVLSTVDSTIKYEHLKKNAEKYTGKPWMFTGKILEIAEKDGLTTARISLDDWGTKAMFVQGMLETPFVEKDRVVVVGVLTGSHTYTSQANWTITIPSIHAVGIISPKDLAKYKAGKR